MTTDASKKVMAYFKSPRDDLKQFFSKLKIRDALEERLSHYLHPSIQKDCCVAHLNGSRLTILTANAAVATQLRFEAANLLKKMQGDPVLKQIKEIHFKVSVNQFISKPPLKNNPMEPLSTETSKTVFEIANTIKDERLQSILKKIAGYVREDR
ncbi:MAG: hypothetical protein A3F12_02920 [Gammaproteobacteria bacterium RIFCSPHIGHO2_12_FULL_38_14]|nr:MAG: hypothetical protein A3F12_02920 [Gammaproteobacteria bacterium RIFCSPHIGHO2_12_FULL_38_14]